MPLGFRPLASRPLASGAAAVVSGAIIGTVVGFAFTTTATIAGAGVTPVRQMLPLLGVAGGIATGGIPSAPTFVAAGTLASGVGATVSPGLPAGLAANDVLLLFTESNTVDGAPATPAGYTLLGTTAGAFSARMTAFSKLAGGSESSPSVANPGNHVGAVLVAFRGIDTASPLDVTTVLGTQGVGTATTTITGVTTLGANRMIVVAIATTNTPATASTFSSGYTNANLTGITEMFDATYPDGNDGGLAGAYGVKAAAGATGSTTATGLDEGRAFCCIALKPA